MTNPAPHLSAHEQAEVDRFGIHEEHKHLAAIMTDERLLEEAAKAIWNADSAVPEAWENKNVVEWDRETYRAMARAALAVFEKAHTPTDGEREALATALHEGQPSYGVGLAGYGLDKRDARALADVALAAGFRRSAAPEPSTKKCPIITTVAGDPWHGCSLHSGHEGRHDFSIRLYGAYPAYGIEGPPEPQGEPSDAHKIIPWSPTGRIDSPVSCQACGRSLFIGHSGDWEHVPQCTATEQGEPSDARWIDEIETMALAQAAGHARMVEIGEGIGGLGVRNRAMFEDMVAWQDATENGHADTVLRLVAALRAGGGEGR